MSDLGSFWARRRAAVAAEEKAARTETVRVEKEEALAGKSDKEILQEFGLPEPETLQAGDDFSGFMAAGVPEHLKRVALRTLWRSNPVLACVDGLNEYDDDYRAAMLLSEPVKTAYQVGKGMKSHLDEMARQASLRENDPSELVPEDVESDEPVLAVQSDADTEGVIDQSPVHIVFELNEEEVSETPPSPRHMRFRFEEAQA